MTAVHDCSTQDRAGETLSVPLRAAHEIWLRESNRFLLPVILKEAPFWSRWTAVRFLADQFAAQYRRERALLDELRVFLPEDVAQRLTRNGERIGRLHQELDRAGRQRGAAPTVSVVSRRFLQLLRSWCADIEEAAGGIPRDALTAEGAQLLQGIEQYARTYA